tara:strand:- start:316 stop:570 length:255 start_codon:yes stop_codon:yes gene_type:complete
MHSIFSRQNKDCLRILDINNRKLVKIGAMMSALSKNKFTYLDTYQSLCTIIYQYKDELGKIYQNKDHFTSFGSNLISNLLRNKL